MNGSSSCSEFCVVRLKKLVSTDKTKSLYYGLLIKHSSYHMHVPNDLCEYIVFIHITMQCHYAGLPYAPYGNIGNDYYHHANESSMWPSVHDYQQSLIPAH